MDIGTSFGEKLIGLILEAIPQRFRETQISRDARLQRDLGLDSMGLLSLIFRIEETFGLNFSGSELQFKATQIRTVNDAIVFIDSHKKEAVADD
jgi:acyl carrier protein